MPVHETRSDVTRFAHVDMTGDAESLIAFLDTANALKRFGVGDLIPPERGTVLFS